MLIASLSNFFIPYVLLHTEDTNPQDVSAILVAMNIAGLIGSFIFNVIRLEAGSEWVSVKITVPHVIIGLFFLYKIPLLGVWFFVLLRVLLLRSPQTEAVSVFLPFLVGLITSSVLVIQSPKVCSHSVSVFLILLTMLNLGAVGLSSIWLPSFTWICNFLTGKNFFGVLKRLGLEIVIVLLPTVILLIADAKMDIGNHRAFLKTFSVLGISGVIGSLLERRIVMSGIGFSDVSLHLVAVNSIIAAVVAGGWVNFTIGLSLSEVVLIGAVAFTGVWASYWISMIRIGTPQNTIVALSIIVIIGFGGILSLFSLLNKWALAHVVCLILSNNLFVIGAAWFLFKCSSLVGLTRN